MDLWVVINKDYCLNNYFLQMVDYIYMIFISFKLAILNLIMLETNSNFSNYYHSKKHSTS